MPYIYAFLCQMLLYNWPIIYFIAILHNAVAEKGGGANILRRNNGK